MLANTNKEKIMTDKELSKEEIDNLIRENVPSLEQQQRIVQEIESMIAQGISPEKAVASVFGKPGNSE